MTKNYYIFFFIIILFIIFIYIYLNPIRSDFKEDAIIIIESNLNDYRIIPDDKGGLPQYDLGILGE